MTNFTLSIDDIEKQTGLTRKYIDRCYARFGSVLESYRKQSPDQNKFLYDSNALSVFQEIRHFKDRGMKLPEIRDRITEELGSPLPEVEKSREAGESNLGSTAANQAMQSSAPEPLLRALQSAYELAIQSVSDRALLLEESIERRTEREREHVERIAAFERANRRRVDLLSRLQALEGKLFTKRKMRAIIREIRGVDSEAQNASPPGASIPDSGNPDGTR